MVYSSDKKQTLYSSGVIVLQSVTSSPGMQTEWPPFSSDLNNTEALKVVPVELHNLIAWCVGASDDPILDHRVGVEDDTYARLLSICQDIVYLASNGRRPTP